MPPAPTLFRTEYEKEMEHWLRRRFALMCIVFFAFEVLNITLSGAALLLGDDGSEAGSTVGLLALTIVSALVITAFFITQRRIHGDRRQTLNLATGLILAIGTTSLIAAFVYAPGERRNTVFLSFFFWHFAASLFLPWTPRESLRPMAPLLAAWTAALIFTEPAARSFSGIAFLALMVLAAAALLLPGIAVSAWRLRRHGRTFQTRMIGKQFFAMREELQRARAIHESMFPEPYDDGFVRMDYVYTPAKEIGGDYIHLHAAAHKGPIHHLTVLDVTGHGLAAALTVNRVFGELERIRAEMPDLGPGDALALLNRYFYLTLARHTIFATAACFTLDSRDGRLTWASAGHPPAFLCRRDRVPVMLPATTVLLGALPSHEFNHEQMEAGLSPGDAVVAYTDGVIEAQDRLGVEFSLRQVEDLLASRPSPRPGGWPRHIDAAVQRHAGGAMNDDVLIASLHLVSLRTAESRANNEAEGERLTATESAA
jgi:hypothetical protein